MTRPPSSVLLVAAVGVAVGAFALGRMTSDEETRERAEEKRSEIWRANHPASEVTRPRVVVSAPTRTSPVPEGAPIDAPPAPAEPVCHDVSVFAQRCSTRLKEREAELTAVEELRTDREGTPIPVRPTASGEPRFAQAALTSSMQQAFAQSRVPGAVEGVDCSEYPCILFGRIEGGEDQMEHVEHTKAMAAYEEDILTVLLWTATDEAAKEAAEERGDDDTGLEQSLFAVALYPKKDKADLGDNLDRRIRSRTAELWNATAPTDETAAR